ncbi:MAG: LysM peptidoglycan-binding domain-containing protein [Anaerolineales bacterium]
MRPILLLPLSLLFLLACQPAMQPGGVVVIPSATPTSIPLPYPTRPVYSPGELVDYVAQDGDTLTALAARFNTTVEQILQANPFIPNQATTMPPGMPMKIPIYYKPLWGTPYQSLPDIAFVNGPADRGFNTSAFVRSHPGWLKDFRDYVAGSWRDGAGIVEQIATDFSISPRLLLAILEYQGRALSDPNLPQTGGYTLGYKDVLHRGVYLQLVWAANTLNHGYYGWRSGQLIEFELLDGRIYRPDPWQNAASVALQYYFSRILPEPAFSQAIGPNGLARTYQRLFGDPWAQKQVLIPGSLSQPPLRLPFPPGRRWAYTGGPHTGWGSGFPWAALDFAPPAPVRGCALPDPQDYAVAVADGIVVRSGLNGLVLDLDGDGDERTGWTIFYLHLALEGRATVGQVLHAGEKIGYPSCESGRVTGTHVHIARKYNGEWILADGPLAFNLDGWIARNGARPYQGFLIRAGEVVNASEYAEGFSQILAQNP